MKDVLLQAEIKKDAESSQNKPLPFLVALYRHCILLLLA